MIPINTELHEEELTTIFLYVVYCRYTSANSLEIKTVDYRVLAKSVTEAAEIVNASNVGVDERITEVREVSHITQLPRNKYVVASLKPKDQP